MIAGRKKGAASNDIHLLRSVPIPLARAEGHQSHHRAPRNAAIRYEKVDLSAIRRGTTFSARHPIQGQKPQQNQ
jgi:hypothetical protein